MKKAHNPLICITSGTSGSPRRSDLYIKAIEEAGGSVELIMPGADAVTKEFINKNTFLKITPQGSALPPLKIRGGKGGVMIPGRGKGELSSPPLRGGDEGEGDICGFSKFSSKYDGLIIPGGDDIDPAFYNEKKVFEIRQEDKLRTALELVLLGKMIKREKPVLGICYGMQLLNVFFKGSLWQDISLRIDKSLVHDKRLHGINITENPFLEKGRFKVNSSHHQAIKKTGKGLRPFAYAGDGIVEAFFLDSYGFLVGVQWHPERMDNRISKKVFEAFIDACRND